MTYLEELTRWNSKINLTGINNPKDIIVKHFLDSLAGLNACTIPLRSTIVDIGSGAGFPGLALKIVREDIQLVVVEPVHKKTAFLMSLIGLLQLKNVSVYDGTVQEYVKLPRNTLADFVVVRALKLSEFMSSISELLRQGGQAILYRAESIDSIEISNDFILENELSFSLPHGYGSRVISVFKMGKAV